MNIKVPLFVMCFVVSVSWQPLLPVAWGWQTRITGNNTDNGRDRAVSIAVDGGGDIFAGGFIEDVDTLRNFTVVKLSQTTGAVRWRQDLNGTANNVDSVKAVAATAGGDVVAAGSIVNVGTGVDFTVVLLDGQDGTVLWRQEVDGVGNFTGVAEDVALDPKGDIIATGTISEAGFFSDFTVVKLSQTTGAVRWRQDLTGTANGNAVGRRVAVDDQGDVIAVGSTVNVGTERDFTVVKLDGQDGTVLWRHDSTGTSPENVGRDDDRGNSVVVDSQGDVIVGGSLVNVNPSPLPTSLLDPVGEVIKLDGDTGAVRWRQEFNLFQGAAQDFSESARVLAVDSAGDVVVSHSATLPGLLVKLAGASGSQLWSIDSGAAFGELVVDAGGDMIGTGIATSTCFGGGTSFTVQKFSGVDGTNHWTQTICPAESVGFAVSIDAVGEVVVAGYTSRGGTFFPEDNTDFTVVKLSQTTGAVTWRKDFDGTRQASVDLATAIAMTAEGDVVAAGVLDNEGTGTDMMVTRLGGSGGLEFLRTIINGTAPGDQARDGASAVAVDQKGDVIVAGQTTNLDSGEDFTVVKLRRHADTVRWRQALTGTAEGRDAARAVVIDHRGDVIAAGVITNAGTGSDFTVVKLGREGGEVRWLRMLSGSATRSVDHDEANAVAVDQQGNVVAVGVMTNEGTGVDFTIVKLDGKEGTVLWRQALQGTFSGGNEPKAVVLDHQGDVIVAGKISNVDSDSDFTVVKLSGVTGVVLWQQTLDGGANDFDQALAVTVDARGDVIAAGSLDHDVTKNQSFGVVKLAGTSGAVRWIQLLTGTDIFVRPPGGPPPGGLPSTVNIAFAVTVDARGDVIAAGTLDNKDLGLPLRGTSLAVVKLEDLGGEELWRHELAFGAPDATGEGCNIAVCLFNFAAAVRVDARGDVIAAGFRLVGRTVYDFTVVKVQGSDGADLPFFPGPPDPS